MVAKRPPARSRGSKISAKTFSTFFLFSLFHSQTRNVTITTKTSNKMSMLFSLISSQMHFWTLVVPFNFQVSGIHSMRTQEVDFTHWNTLQQREKKGLSGLHLQFSLSAKTFRICQKTQICPKIILMTKICHYKQHIIFKAWKVSEENLNSQLSCYVIVS
jgi:hypothetical protein